MFPRSSRRGRSRGRTRATRRLRGRRPRAAPRTTAPPIPLPRTHTGRTPAAPAGRETDATGRGSRPHRRRRSAPGRARASRASRRRPSGAPRHASPLAAIIGAMNRKLVVFVPVASLDDVRDALFEAGAGRIGDYERCSWYTEGTGTFRGGEGTQPAIGEAGREERVRELRVETVFPAERHEQVVEALRRAHPYEEPAFDVYELL